MTIKETTYVYKQEGLQAVQRELDKTGQAAEQATRRISGGAKDGSAALKGVDAAVRELRAGAEDLADRGLGPLAGVMRAMGPAAGTLAAALGGVGVVLANGVREAAQAERAMVKIEAVLRATGGASGLTAQQIDGLSKALARSTLATETEAKAAATQLLAFRNVAGETFGEVLRLSQDLAAAGFGGLAENAVKLGRALEDPAQGLAGLSRAGLLFTEEQKKTIAALQETGRTAEAAALILDNVRDRVGGTGAAERDTLIGAFHGLTEATSAWFETVGERSGLLNVFKGALDGLTESVNRATAAMAAPPPNLDAVSRPDYLGRRTPDVAALQAEVRRLAAEAAALEEKAAALRALAAAEAERDAKRLKAEQDVAEYVRVVTQEELKRGAAQEQTVEVVREHVKVNLDLEATQRVLDGLARRRETTERAAAEAARERAAEEREWARAQADYLKEQQRAFETFYRDGVNLFVEAFLDPTEDGFKGMLERMGEILKRQLIAMAAEAALRPILVPIYAAMYGGGGAGSGAASAGSGLSGLTSLSSLGGLGELSVYGQAFAGAGLGAFAGSGIGGALGLSKTGSAIGGGLGGFGALPYALAGGNPAIAAGFYLASTVLGGLIGKLFSGKPSDRTEGTLWNIQTGATRDLGFSGAKDSPENTQAVSSFIGAAQEFKALLERTTGGRVALDELDYRVGDRSGIQLRLGADSGTFGTAEQAFAFVMERFAGSLEGVTPRVKAALDKIDFDNLEAATAALGAILDRESALSAVRDELKRLTDPKAYALDQLEAAFKDLRTQFAEDAEALVDIEALYGRKRADVVAQFAEKTVEDTVEALRPLGDVLGRVRDAYSALIATREDEIRAMDAARSGWQRIGQALRAQRQGLAFDSALSPFSLEQRARDSLNLFRETRSLAEGGDLDAAERLGELGRTALEAAREFYRSSEPYAAIFAEVSGGLQGVETYASRQASIAEMQLGVLQQIRDGLIAQRGGVGAAAPGAALYNAADAGQLTSAYAAARQRFLDAGGSEAAWLAGTEHRQVWEPARDALIAGLSDTSLLQESLANARAQRGNPLTARIGADYEAAVVARMRALGLEVPSFDGGGWVTSTGLAMVHQGEAVVPTRGGAIPVDTAGLRAEVAALRRQVEQLTRVAATAGDRQVDLLAAVAQSNREMAQGERLRSSVLADPGRVLK